MKCLQFTVLLFALFIGSAAHAVAASSGTAVITTSGSTQTLGGPGNTGTFEEIIAGSPSTVSIVLKGCMPGGTCDVLETNTSTAATQNRTPTVNGIYNHFTVTASWTGGTNVSITVTAIVATAGKGGSGVGGAVASVAGKTGVVTLVASDVSGTEATANKDAVNGYAGLDSGGLLKTAEFPTPTTTTFGGVKDKAAVSNNFVTSVVGGVPVLARPACASLSDSGTGCSATLAAVATSGSATDLGSGTLPVARFPAFTNHSLLFGSGSAGSPNLLASPTANGAYSCGFNIVASAAVDPTCVLSGVPTNAQTGTSYTVLYSDRLGYVSFSNASPIAVTLPQAGSAGFTSNFGFLACDIGAGTATITPTTSTISSSDGVAYTSGASSVVLSTGQCASIYSDNTNYFAVLKNGNASKSTVAANTGFALPAGAGPTPTVDGNISEDTTTHTLRCGNGTTTTRCMVQALISGCGNAGVTNISGATSFVKITGGVACANNTEATVRQMLPLAGTVTNLCVTTTGAQPASGSLVVTLKDTTTGVDSALTTTFALSQGATKAQCDTTHSATITAGDDYSLEFKNNASATAATTAGISMLYTY